MTNYDLYKRVRGLCNWFLLGLLLPSGCADTKSQSGSNSTSTKATTNVTNRSHAVAFDLSPNGNQIVFAVTENYAANLYLLDLKNSRVTQINKFAIPTLASEVKPRFSPDGKFITYAAADSKRSANCIFISSVAGKSTTQLTSGAVFDSVPSFSPDGSMIVFARSFRLRPNSRGTSMVYDHTDLCLMKRDGSRLKRLTQQNYMEMIYGARFFS